MKHFILIYLLLLRIAIAADTTSEQSGISMQAGFLNSVLPFFEILEKEFASVPLSKEHAKDEQYSRLKNFQHTSEMLMKIEWTSFGMSPLPLLRGDLENILRHAKSSYASGLPFNLKSSYQEAHQNLRSLINSIKNEIGDTRGVNIDSEAFRKGQSLALSFVLHSLGSNSGNLYTLKGLDVDNQTKRFNRALKMYLDFARKNTQPHLAEAATLMKKTIEKHIALTEPIGPIDKFIAFFPNLIDHLNARANGVKIKFEITDLGALKDDFAEELSKISRRMKSNLFASILKVRFEHLHTGNGQRINQISSVLSRLEEFQYSTPETPNKSDLIQKIKSLLSTLKIGMDYINTWQRLLQNQGQSQERFDTLGTLYTTLASPYNLSLELIDQLNNRHSEPDFLLRLAETLTKISVSLTNAIDHTVEASKMESVKMCGRYYKY